MLLFQTDTTPVRFACFVSDFSDSKIVRFDVQYGVIQREPESEGASLLSW